jgi:competence protein ComEC
LKRKHRDILNRTGTTHLLIVSGLHVGLIASKVLLPFQLTIARLFVVLLDPLATLGYGFWLSFGAVCALLLGLSGRVDAEKGLARWVSSSLRAQWVVFLSLLPVLGSTSFQLPLGSMFVNLIAIPVVGMLLVPLFLVSLLVFAAFPLLGQSLLG